MTVEPIEAYVPTHAFELNGLNLIGGTGEEGWVVNALGSSQETGDFTLGNPVAVITEVLEQILDGSLASVESYDNREVDIPILLSAPDGPSLAAGEQALVEACNGTDGLGLLIWTPPSIAAEPSVFEVVNAILEFSSTDDWDIRERQDYGPQRGYMLNLACKPFARSMDKVEIPGLPVASGAVPTIVSDGATTSGWVSGAYVPALGHHNDVTNPAFEIDTAGWTDGANMQTPITRVPGGGIVDWAAEGVPDSPDVALMYYNSDPILPTDPQVGVIIGMSQRWDATVTSGPHPSSATVGFLARIYDANDVLLSQLDLGVRSIPRGTWSKVAARIDLGIDHVGASYIRLHPYTRRPNFSSSAKGAAWTSRLSRIVLTEDTGNAEKDANPYFDGNTPDKSHVTYSWAGAVGASKSVATYDTQSLTSDGDKVTAIWYGADFITLSYWTPFNVPDNRPFIRISGSYAWNLDEPRTDQINLAFNVNGEGWLPPVAFTASNGTWAAALNYTGDVTSLTVEAYASDAAYDVGVSLSVDDVTLSDVPNDGTGRQTSRVIPVYGSMRSEADILVTSATSAGVPQPLGSETLVYSVPVAAGVGAPSLRQWRTAGGAIVVEAARISGAREEVPTSEAGALTFEIPADQIRKGTHAFYAALAMTEAGPKFFHWSATVATAYSSHTETGEVWIDLDGAYRIAPIAHVTLPPADIGPSADATVTLKLWTVSGAVVQFDEGWVFNVDDGQVSLIDTSGGPSMVRLNSATIDYPLPSCWIGDADTDVNTIHAGARAQFDQHIFPPGEISVFTVATTSPSVSTALAYYPRWHTHPAPLPTEGGGPE